MIDLNVNKKQREINIKRCKERNIRIPTFKQMRNPDTIPDYIKKELETVGLWDVNPLNLFRITWKNEPKQKGGKFGNVNCIEIPRELTGVEARIIAVVGKWFPTGAHKVGATFGCLAPKLVTGQFNPTGEKAVWPSTGNYCRGGAYNSALLGCESIAILPEEMSKERFEWLNNIAGEVIATPGCESNVKEIYDKCWELRETRDDIHIFNQFAEFGNYLWHYDITGNAIVEAFENLTSNSLLSVRKSRLFGAVFTTGSAGTIASGDFLKDYFPQMKIGAAEALQCPTLLQNGFGGHKIEGIGDKHVPWIHNVKNTDMVIAVDDNDCMSLVRLFNEPAGRELLIKEGIDNDFVENLDLIGISGIANILSAIKMAKYYELGEHDVIATVLTDSMQLYSSRIKEMNELFGEYKPEHAKVDLYAHLYGQKTDNMLELSYYDKKRIHNLKYYTWIEQQKADLNELNRQWYDYDNYWSSIRESVSAIDELIEEFNAEVNL